MNKPISSRNRASLCAFVFAFCVAIPATSAQQSQPWPPAGGEVIDGIAAVVGQEPITVSDFKRSAAPLLRMQAEQPTGDALKELRRQVLQNLIDRLLILGEARALNIEVSSSDVEQGIEDLKTANGWDGAQLQQALVQSGIPSIAAFRRQLREDMLQKQIMGIRVGSRARVNEEQVEAAVAREVGQGGQVQERRASHILLRLPLGAPADQVGEAVTKLTKIRSEAIAGETTFEDLARLHSEDGTAPSGGDLGWFSRGDLDPRFETTVEQLAIDEISEPFRTDFGMHLVKLQGIRGRTADPEVIERLRRQIRHRLREQEIARLYDHWVRGLRDGAHIEIRQLPRLP